MTATIELTNAAGQQVGAASLTVRVDRKARHVLVWVDGEAVAVPIIRRRVEAPRGARRRAK